MIYGADVTNNIDSEKLIYLGASGATFKEGYRNHVKNTKHENYLSMSGI